MPAGVRSIILGGGLGVGIPATIGNIPQFAGSNPPDILIDSILRQVAGPPEAIIVGATDPAPAAVETFRTDGGIISLGLSFASTVLGEGAHAGPAGANGPIAIGNGAVIGAVGGNTASSIVIGRNVSYSTTANGGGLTSDSESAIVIGVNTVVSSVGSSQPNGYMIVIGNGNTITSTIGSTSAVCTYIGHIIAPGNAANNMIVLGSNFTGSSQNENVIAIGGNISHANGSVHNVLIGFGVSSAGASNNVIIGRSAQVTSGPDQVVVGALARTDQDFCIAIGANARAQQAGTIAIGRQANTGNLANVMAMGTGAAPAIAGQVVFGSGNTGAQFIDFLFGSRGPLSSVNLDVTWHISDADYNAGSNQSAGNLIIRGGINTGNQTVGGEIQFQTGVVGASGFAQQTLRKRFAILKNPGSAPNPAFGVYDVTDGAGAGAGTLGNAPTAGDPAFWLPVDVGGVIMYIPCWT